MFEFYRDDKTVEFRILAGLNAYVLLSAGCLSMEGTT